MTETDSASGASPSALNREGLLDRVMGDEDLANELVQDFLQDAPAHVRALSEMIAADDARGAERTAHFIKGAAAAIGADAMWEVALGLENAGKNGDMEALVAGAPALELELERLRKAADASG